MSRNARPVAHRQDPHAKFGGAHPAVAQAGASQLRTPDLPANDDIAGASPLDHVAHYSQRARVIILISASLMSWAAVISLFR